MVQSAHLYLIYKFKVITLLKKMELNYKQINKITRLDTNNIEKYISKQEKFVVDSSIYKSRNIVKFFFNIDFLLKKNGLLYIMKKNKTEHGMFSRSFSQVRYIVSNYFKFSYELIDTNNKFYIFKKTRSSRSYSKRIKSLSFGYISNGKNLKLLKHSISSIKKNCPIPFEISVCGPKKILNNIFFKKNNITFIPEKKNISSRANINSKKNLIIKRASMDNLILCHDHISFDKYFFERLIDYGNYFDFYDLDRRDLITGNLSISSRVSFIYPITSFSYKPLIKSFQSSDSPNLFMNGSLYIGKTALFKKILLDEHLYWDELEDLHFSEKIRLNGFVINQDSQNYALTSSLRHGKLNFKYFFFRFIKKIISILYLIIIYIKFRKTIIN